MTVNELMTACNFEAVCLPDADREVSGAYVGDLLSWVMGRAQADNAWITIMSNVNVIAVASLSDVACVILAEGVNLDDELKATAEQKEINVLRTDLPAFEAAQALTGKV
ncbi:MAG: hypothetical protein IJI47_01810 [Eubacterium sp.]|nr:hypothetical protein [Eubacterium sp.]